MTSQTYLVLISDGGLAVAVAEALEQRLTADGHKSLVLVPPARGRDLAEFDRDRILQAAPREGGQAPQVVALYQEGALERLESLGLAAYVGVPEDHEWRVIHWASGTGAIMLPVTTAHDLVDAVADHTPWSDFTDSAPAAASRRPRLGARAPLVRRIATAGAFGAASPLLLLGMPLFSASAATFPGLISRPAPNVGLNLPLNNPDKDYRVVPDSAAAQDYHDNQSTIPYEFTPKGVDNSNVDDSNPAPAAPATKPSTDPNDTTPDHIDNPNNLPAQPKDWLPDPNDPNVDDAQNGAGNTVAASRGLQNDALNNLTDTQNARAQADDSDLANANQQSQDQTTSQSQDQTDQNQTSQNQDQTDQNQTSQNQDQDQTTSQSQDQTDQNQTDQTQAGQDQTDQDQTQAGQDQTGGSQGGGATGAFGDGTTDSLGGGTTDSLGGGTTDSLGSGTTDSLLGSTTGGFSGAAGSLSGVGAGSLSAGTTDSLAGSMGSLGGTTDSLAGSLGSFGGGMGSLGGTTDSPAGSAAGSLSGVGASSVGFSTGYSAAGSSS